MILTPKHTNSHFLAPPENFDTSTAGGASDQYQVCVRQERLKEEKLGGGVSHHLTHPLID